MSILVVSRLALVVSIASVVSAAERFDEPVTIRGQVIDEHDRPVGGAQVFAGAPWMGSTLSWTQEGARVSSGDDGRFELKLPFGDVAYSLQVQRMGFDAPATPFVATPARSKEPFKVRLRRGLHEDLKGRVIDSQLKPISDLPLTLVGEYGFSQTAKTDGAGEFVFGAVPEYIGQPVIVAHKKGWGIPQAIVRRGEIGGKGLELLLAPTGRLEGQVIDVATGDAIKNAEVSIRPWFSSGFALKAKSDAKGRFAIEEVPTGSYLVEPSAAKHFDKPPRGMSHERERVMILPGETVTQKIPMQQRAVIRGRILDPDGRAVAGAIVGLPCTWEGDYRNQVDAVRTDAGGNFELATGHLEEELHLSAFSSRFGGANLALAPLVEGDLREGLTLTLPGAVRVRGRVVDDRDRPIASVIAALENVSAESGDDGCFDLGRVTLTKDSASLALHAPRPAAVSWITSIYGSKVVPDAAAWYRDATFPFDANPGDELDLKVKLEPTDLLVVKGRIIDAEGQPIKEAKLYLFAGNASDTWTNQAIPNFTGSRVTVSEDRMLADASADADGKFRLKTVRFDGEATKAGTRYSIGVVVDNAAKKLVQELVLSLDKGEREIEIQLAD